MRSRHIPFRSFLEGLRRRLPGFMATRRRTIPARKQVITETREPRTLREFLHLRFRKVDPYDPGDKIAVRNLVRSFGFETPRTYAIHSHPAEMDFSKLPDAFVVKPTSLAAKRGIHILHRIAGEEEYWDSLSRTRVRKEDVVSNLAMWRDLCSPARRGRFRVMVEEYVPGRPHDRIPLDYKFYTFNGEIRLILQIDRNVSPEAVFFYDRDFSIKDYRSFVAPLPRRVRIGDPVVPAAADRMIEIACALSILLKTPFMRIDMYDAPRGPLVGELTHASGGPYFGGAYRLTPDYDRELGGLWREAALALGAPIHLLAKDDVIPRGLPKLPPSL